MPTPAPAVDIGVDIGGTFTDIVCRRAGESMRTLKIPTTRGDPSQAVLNAITHLARDLGVGPTEIAQPALELRNLPLPSLAPQPTVRAGPLRVVVQRQQAIQ